MRSIKLQLSESQVFEIKLPGGEPSTENVFSRGRLIKIVRNLSSWLILAGVVLLPFVFQWVRNPLTEVPYLVFALVFILIALTLIGTTLAGWGFLVDPPLFVPVLVFALLVILSYLLAEIPTNLSSEFIGANTFGLDPIKYLAGIYVMTFVGVFYFVHLFFHSKSKLLTLSRSIITSLVIFNILTLFDGGLGFSFALVTLISIPVLLNYVLFGSARWLGILSLVGFLAGVISVLNSEVTFVFLLVTILSLVISIFGILLSNNWELGNPWTDLIGTAKVMFESPRGRWRLVKQNSFFILTSLLIVTIAGTILWAVNNPQLLSDSINGIADSYSSAYKLINELPAFLVGKGATVLPRQTTMSTILTYQGLAGLVAYAVLTVTAIYTAVKNIKISKSESGMIMLPIVITIPVLALLTQLSFAVSAIWWIIFAYLAANLAVKTEPAVDKIVDQIKWWRFSLTKYVSWLQFIAIGVILIFTLYALPLLRNQLI